MNTLHPASRVSEQRFYHLSENSAIRERSGESLSQCSPFERFFLQNGGWVLSRRRWLWMRNWKWKRKTIRLMPSFLWLLFSSMVTSSASDILETPGNFPRPRVNIFLPRLFLLCYGDLTFFCSSVASSCNANSHPMYLQTLAWVQDFSLGSLSHPVPLSLVDRHKKASKVVARPKSASDIECFDSEWLLMKEQNTSHAPMSIISPSLAISSLLKDARSVCDAHCYKWPCCASRFPIHKVICGRQGDLHIFPFFTCIYFHVEMPNLNALYRNITSNMPQKSFLWSGQSRMRFRSLLWINGKCCSPWGKALDSLLKWKLRSFRNDLSNTWKA